MTPEEIKALRKTKGLAQEQLATMMQVDSTTIYRWENGIVTPSLVKTAILRDILIKAGDGRTHPFVSHLLSRKQATARYPSGAHSEASGERGCHHSRWQEGGFVRHASDMSFRGRMARALDQMPSRKQGSADSIRCR